MENDIIEKLKSAGLTGHSGSGFPTHLKWQVVKDAKSNSKYVVCNFSEGEPGINKDKYIMENFINEVIAGIDLAMKTIGAKTGYIYINPEYYPLFKEKLISAIGNLPIELFKKPHHYIAGEETTALNLIEGKTMEPRIKPPFPTEKGLFEKPTLINNVETLYWVYKIAKNEYHNERFFCVGGEVANPGVFLLKETSTIADILEQTRNTPCFDFFVKAGGQISGEVLLENELSTPIKGAPSIVIYNKETVKPLELLKKWANFYNDNNCDRCTPCREGIYRIKEILDITPLNKTAIFDILFALEKTSFCPFGRLAANAFKTALSKLF